jgi:hypothetical protein
VRPDAIHRMTRADLLSGNADLLEAAGALLAGMPRRQLDVTTSMSGTTLTVELDVLGIDRVDLYLDDRPMSSEDLVGAPVTIEIVDVSAGQLLRADAFFGGQLVGSRRVSV